jgi:coenzyme F420-reducing hydrogenase delta subunit
VQKQLEEIGLNGRRIQMMNLSAAMGAQFAFTAAELTAEIKGIGPNPLGKSSLSGELISPSEPDPSNQE